MLLDNTAAGAARVADAGLEVRWDAGAPPAGVDTARGARFLGYVHTEASPRYAGGDFGGLMAEFRAMGYDVGTPGCLSSGHMRHSKHLQD